MEGRPAPSTRPSLVESPAKTPLGAFVELDGETYYRISSVQRMAPFMVSLASDTDLWMFVTSGGGLTAGRSDAEGSLFPYRTIDQLHDAHHHTGPLTLIRIERENEGHVLWEPLCEANAENPAFERNLYKNTVGNRLVFEEIDHELGLVFRYRWAGCDEFGWVRTSTLENRGPARVNAAFLDGLRNVLPHGAPLSLYQQASNLVDAYKKSEVDPESGLGIFSLTAGITDRAEALESLRANIVWCSGLDDFRVHLSLEAAAVFRHGQIVVEDDVLNGGRGNYLVSSSVELEPGESTSWNLAADVGRDHVQIAALRRRLLSGEDLASRIDERLDEASDELRRNVGSADGMQLTGHATTSSHHFANVLFNNMRGGVFAHNYDVSVNDFREFLETRNHTVAEHHEAELAGWPDPLTIQSLRSLARTTGDADLERLAHEYLPLHFARRHGDPSRPWNRFTIRARKENGERALNYEGNWRDIFQNWEALSTAFPGALPSMVAKFVNASTVDGFNPYRITREGVDWEIVSPDDPWSNIGYWGDHQIVYLLKLLEAMDRYDPAALDDLLDAPIFSYAEVPYVIKPYQEMLADPASTIEFDDERAARIDERVARIGTDGKLLMGPDRAVYHASFLEKLLVPALSKLSNLIPDAGIWMNTQRPEWNDANNALAAGGISVVTLCYLRRYLAYLAAVLSGQPDRELDVAAEVANWLEQIAGILEDERAGLASDAHEPRDRKRLMDRLGGAFDAYRETVYANGFSGRRTIAAGRVIELCNTALAYVDHGIAANERDDGLYHSYNLLEVADDRAGVTIARLPEMLEGQVAVLSSGAVDPAQALTILERLFASDLYRSDERSFLLYPERQLPGFMEKNVVPDASVENIPLLRELLAVEDDSVLHRDVDGVCRFQGEMSNGCDLEVALDELAEQPAWSPLVAQDRDEVLDLFEDVFQHRSYTGRSGFMYGYEGLGCIYWHMVAKLLLAVQENYLRAVAEDQPTAVQDGLAGMYYKVRSGIGYEKTAAQYGAFPTDPYSHTPAESGAKQPGMTGQVKEEILTRLGELGVQVDRGAVRFQPRLLLGSDFLTEPADFRYYDVAGEERTIAVRAGCLAFTICQVPVIYERTTLEAWVRVDDADGSATVHRGDVLEADLAAKLFARDGRIQRIQVGVPEYLIDRHR